MQKLITKIALCRFGVNSFEQEVNAYIEAGWDLEEYDVEPHFLRIVCSALLEKDSCSCDCSCCKKHKE